MVYLIEFRVKTTILISLFNDTHHIHGMNAKYDAVLRFSVITSELVSDTISRDQSLVKPMYAGLPTESPLFQLVTLTSVICASSSIIREREDIINVP